MTEKKELLYEHSSSSAIYIPRSAYMQQRVVPRDKPNVICSGNYIAFSIGGTCRFDRIILSWVLSTQGIQSL